MQTNIKLCQRGCWASTIAMPLVFALAISVHAHAQKIVPFDAPGADTAAGSGNGTFASGINNWGVVAGSYIDANDVYHGFLRSPEGSFTTFEAPGADTTPGSFNGTGPNSVNDLGAITGEYYDASGFGHGFLRSPEGKFTTFEVPGAAGYGTTPIAIDLEGGVVGYFTDSTYAFHSFLRSPDGHFTTWNGPDQCTGNGSEGCYGGAASNINAFGTIAGGFEDNSGNFVHHGYVRNAEGELKTFDVPGAGTGSYQGTGCPGCFLGLNQLGAVAGIYSDANSVNHGFVRSPNGTITTFNAPGAGTGTYEGTGCFSDCPVSLNDWGAITGVYIDANFMLHGYLRNPQGKIATVDPPGSTGTLPYGINDSGAITGYYLDANNVYHGFLRIPD
jgi:hypothetical protein